MDGGTEFVRYLQGSNISANIGNRRLARTNEYVNSKWFSRAINVYGGLVGPLDSRQFTLEQG